MAGPNEERRSARSKIALGILAVNEKTFTVYCYAYVGRDDHAMTFYAVAQNKARNRDTMHSEGKGGVTTAITSAAATIIIKEK